MTLDREYEAQPIFPSTVAFAKARRTFNELEKSKARTSELIGDPYHEVDPTQAELSIAQLALNNERLLRSKGNASLMTTVVIEDTRERLAGLLESDLDIPEEIQITDKQRHQLSVQCADYFTEMLYLDSAYDFAKSYLAEMEGAEQLARERNKDVSAVYEDDLLYGDLIRRVYTPMSRASLKIRIADAMTYEKAQQIVLNDRRNFCFAILYSEVELGMEQPSQDELEEFLDAINALAKSPEITKESQELADTERRVNYILAAEEIERFWGIDAIDELPDRVREQMKHYRNEPTSH